MTEPDVEAPIGWWTLSAARSAWPDAVKPGDDNVTRLLAVAFGQCEPKAVIEVPVLDDAGAAVLDEHGDPVTRWRRWRDGDEVPDRLRQAQLLQARAVWAFERTGGGDAVGGDGYTVRVYPMGWQVEALLRPDEACAVIG